MVLFEERYVQAWPACKSPWYPKRRHLQRTVGRMCTRFHQQFIANIDHPIVIGHVRNHKRFPRPNSSRKLCWRFDQINVKRLYFQDWQLCVYRVHLRSLNWRAMLHFWDVIDWLLWISSSYTKKKAFPSVEVPKPRVMRSLIGYRIVGCIEIPFAWLSAGGTRSSHRSDPRKAVSFATITHQ